MHSTSNVIKPLSVAVRGGTALAVAALVGVWLWAVASRAASALGSGVPLRADELLTALAAGAALVGLAWLVLGMSLGLLGLVPGGVGRAARFVGEVVTPRLLRRAVGVVLGCGVVAGLSPGASVASPPQSLVTAAPLPDPGFRPLPDPGWTGTTDAGAAGPASEAAATDPGWVPTVPPVRPQPDVRVLSRAPGAPRGAPAEVVVRRGDSLWSIAARHLGPDASDAEIAEAWPAWFAANRDVVGADPDVLLPGQVLRAPDVVGSS